MHGKVNPIDEYPVIGLSLGHPVSVQPFFNVVHHRHHAWPHFAHEVCVGSILIVVEDGFEPVERIVHDGVDVGGDGVFAAQLTDGALDALRVEAQIVVHQVRLDGIARPRPAVALDAVHEELACGEVHRVGCHIPDAVDAVVRASERTRMLPVVGGVFVVHQHVVVAGTRVLLDINEAERLACEV